MLNEIVAKAEEIVSSLEYGLRIEYEHDGFYSCKFKIFANGEERSLGKIIFNPDTKTFIYKKYDKGHEDVFFLNWAIIANLRLKDQIEIAQPTNKKSEINRYTIGVRKLCEKADFVNLHDKGFGLQILLNKDKAKCEKMKFNKSKRTYEVINERK